jgi:hypothetical protein
MIVHGQLELKLASDRAGAGGLYDQIRWALAMVGRARLREARVLMASLGPVAPVATPSGWCRVPLVLVVEPFEKHWLGAYEVAPNAYDQTPGVRVVLEGVVGAYLERVFELTPA